MCGGSISHGPLTYAFSVSQALPVPRLLHPILCLPKLLASPAGWAAPPLQASPSPSLTDPRMTWTLLGAGARLGLEEGCPDPPC